MPAGFSEPSDLNQRLKVKSSPAPKSKSGSSVLDSQLEPFPFQAFPNLPESVQDVVDSVKSKLLIDWSLATVPYPSSKVQCAVADPIGEPGAG